MSTTMKFESGTDVLQFEDGGDYPAKRRNEVIQTSDRLASGSLQTETLGINIQTRVINWSLMSLNDYNELLDWFLNIVNAGQQSFSFTDEYGYEGNVTFIDKVIDFDEIALNVFSGSVTLEYV